MEMDIWKMKNLSICDDVEEWAEKENLDLNALLGDVMMNWEEIKEKLE